MVSTNSKVSDIPWWQTQCLFLCGKDSGDHRHHNLCWGIHCLLLDFSWHHLSSWQELTQCKLLLLKTSHQFRGKAWLHLSQHLSQRCSSSSTFNRLVPHESVSLQFSNLHVSTPPKILIIGLVASISSKFCGSWNNGTHHWSFGQCHFCHWCAKCEGQPHVNCPFKASKFYPQHQWWNSRRTFLRTLHEGS